MKPLLLMLLAPLAAAAANEAQIACDLERSRAEVQASTLASPSAFGSIGDATNSERNIVAGVAQSLSGRTRAALLRESASAKCEAMTATLALDEHERWAMANVRRRAAEAELAQVDEALALSRENVTLLDAQLLARTATVNQAIDARTQLTAIEMRKADLLVILAAPVEPAPKQDLNALLREAGEKTARAAGLASKASSESGWDVVVSAGGRYSLADGSAAPFASVALTYSFGVEASRAASLDVERHTADLLRAQAGGYSQTVARGGAALKGLQQAETARQAALAPQRAELRRTYATLAGMNTALAENTRRTLRIQMKLLEAEANGCWERLTGYTQLLESHQ